MAPIDEKIKAFEDAFDVAPAPNVRALWLAEQYAEVGIKVFPLRVDKIPLIEGWKERGTTDLKQLEKWFLNSSFSKRAVMVGMHCGANGLVALDADRKPNKENGVENLRNLYAELRIDPATQFPGLPITLSPSGSLHHIYKQPFEGGRIGCSTGRLPPQIDVRGDGGLVALPGSMNGKGVYTTAPGAASLIDSFSRGSIPYLPQSLARIIGTKRGGAAGAWSGEPLLPDDLLARILDALPNDTDYFGDRDKWVQFGFSVFAASGGEAREEWLQWCAKWDGGGDPDKDAHFWDTISPGDVRSRIGEIMRALDHFGLDDLAHDVRMFEAADAFSTDDDPPSAASIGEIATRAETKSEPAKPDAEPKAADEFRTFAALQDREFEPVKYVMPGYIAEGATLLAGRPKLGKSWLTLELAFAVASGGSCMGIQCEQGAVLLLALEDNERRLQSRAKRQWPLSRWPARLYYETEWPRGVAAARKIEKWLQSHRDARLVVVDVLANVRDPRGSKESQYEADYGAIKGLQSLAMKYRVAVVIVHHTRKGGGDADPFEKISGTLGLSGAADTALILDRDGSGCTLYGRGRDIEEIETAVQFHKPTGKWSILGKAEEVRRSDGRREVLNLLLTIDEPLTPSEIARELSEKTNTVKSLLRRMTTAGEVSKSRSRRGAYFHSERPGVDDKTRNGGK
jgi:hypothetical protein